MKLRRALQSFLALAGLAGLAALVWLAILEPAAAWKATQFRERDATAEKIAALRDSISRLKAERAGLDAGTDDGIIWPARQMGEATARVQSEISAAASANGVSLRSITPTDSGSLPVARTVSFRIEAEARLDALRDFLVALEFNSPALLIDRATLRRVSRVDDDGAQPLLFAQIEITAPVSAAESAEAGQ